MILKTGPKTRTSFCDRQTAEGAREIATLKPFYAKVSQSRGSLRAELPVSRRNFSTLLRIGTGVTYTGDSVR